MYPTTEPHSCSQGHEALSSAPEPKCNIPWSFPARRQRAHVAPSFEDTLSRSSQDSFPVDQLLLSGRWRPSWGWLCSPRFFSFFSTVLTEQCLHSPASFQGCSYSLLQLYFLWRNSNCWETDSASWKLRPPICNEDVQRLWNYILSRWFPLRSLLWVFCSHMFPCFSWRNCMIHGQVMNAHTFP